MDNNDIIELLDILYGMVTEAWGVPLGNDKCIIEREKAIEIINDIKANLPSALAEAKRLVAARDEFIGNAKREAEALRKSAEEKARTMVEEQEVVRVARTRSAEMIASAEAKSNELRWVASEYVDDIMRQAEESMSSAHENGVSRMWFNPHCRVDNNLLLASSPSCGDFTINSDFAA